MSKRFITNTLLTLLGLLAIFIGGLMVPAVLGWLEWSSVWDWSGKAALVAIISFAIVIVTTILAKFLPSNKS